MGTRILGCDPVTYTLREAGNGVVVNVDDGVAILSALAGEFSLFGERVKSCFGMLMGGSFLRMTGYEAMGWSVVGRNEKSRFCIECGLEILILAMPLSSAGIIQVRYEGRPKYFGHLSINAPLAM